MFQSVRHVAEQEGFIKFLSRALSHHNEEGITKWVKDKLLNDSANTSQSTREAFFEAEKVLIDAYTKEGNVDKVIVLMNAINGNDNQLLRKYQCNLLLLFLREQQHVLHDNPEQLQKLQEFLKTECDKLEGEHKQEVSNEVATYLSNVKRAEGFHQRGI